MAIFKDLLIYMTILIEKFRLKKNIVDKNTSFIILAFL